MSDKNKNKEAVMKFALKELKKTIDSLKKGKAPVVSPELKKIFNMLNDTNTIVEKENLPEEVMDTVLEEVAKKINKEDVK